MIIECNRKFEKTFDEIEIGECFKYNLTYFIKGSIYKNGKKVAVNLNTGVIFEFDDKESVCPISKAKIMIEE